MAYKVFPKDLMNIINSYLVDTNDAKLNYEVVLYHIRTLRIPECSNCTQLFTCGNYITVIERPTLNYRAFFCSKCFYKRTLKGMEGMLFNVAHDTKRMIYEASKYIKCKEWEYRIKRAFWCSRYMNIDIFELSKKLKLRMEIIKMA